jgi:hypothetical protein
MESAPPPKKRPRGDSKRAELRAARTSDEKQMHTLFPPDDSAEAAAAGSTPRKGLWVAERDGAGRPTFTHNSRLVNFVRNTLAEADAADTAVVSPGGGGESDGTSPRSAKATRQIWPAVHC